ncbi:hypothetical protein [Paraburkholderia sp. UCT31]|uniref:hypothetical protein n=1 Tax=Paraburkholderia sp. UCT31 TaxID=2615209 RepID=UPI001655826F|nr:hypothetical protein [Paraburkholderia sp. UCT31]
MTLRMMSRWPGRSRLIPNTSRSVLRIAFRLADVSRGMEVSVMKLAVGRSRERDVLIRHDVTFMAKRVDS